MVSLCRGCAEYRVLARGAECGDVVLMMGREGRLAVEFGSLARIGERCESCWEIVLDSSEGVMAM